MDKKLITTADIVKYRPLSKDIPKDRLEPFITEAQSIDLQSVLGDALYYDFMSKYDVSGDPKYTVYQKLLVGGTYTPPGYTGLIEFEGIKPMLVYYALARFYENNQLNATRYGIVSKLNEFSEPVSQASLTAAISAVRSMGMAYQEKVRRFLNENPTDYPLFTSGRKEDLQQSGVKFFDV
jgi:hypothetical protein